MDVEADVVDRDQPAEAAIDGVDAHQLRTRCRLCLARQGSGLLWPAAHRLRNPLRDKGDDAVARVLEEDDEQGREDYNLELTRCARCDQRQQVLNIVFQQGYQRRTDHRAEQIARAADHRHHQENDAGCDVERRRADEAVEMRVEPARDGREKSGDDKSRQPDLHCVDAEGFDKRIAATQRPQRTADP